MRSALLYCVIQLTACLVSAAPPTPNTFVEVARDDIGGHYFSQVIYAPTIDALVTWGTRTHSKPIRAHETQHYLVRDGKWVDAWPPGTADTWAGRFKRWGGWNICAIRGEWYQRDGVGMPRPNSTFHQVCWDGHNQRIIYYVGSMTFSYRPVRRVWKRIRPPNAPDQPPAMLLWASLCYDPVGRRVILFGGGGVDAPDGRPHTWSLDVTDDTWRRLDLDVEPPARCNSRMVYDRRNRLIVLFGGDAQDRALADTWVFDVTASRWQQRRPSRSPHPRSCHAMAYLDGSGIVLMVGGHAVADYRQADRLSRQAWVYDAKANTWTSLACDVPRWQWASMEALPGTDEALLVTAAKYDHSRVTYRFRYDPAAGPGKHKGAEPGFVAYKTSRTRQWYDDQPATDRTAQVRRIASMPVNRWVEMAPPKSGAGRTWGTSLFDVDHGVAMKTGGGHSGYQGTDMLFYDVGADRVTIDRTPAFTPWPFERWARRPAGRTFFNQPWARHMRHTCAYDRVRKVGVFSDAGGSEWYRRDVDQFVKYTWLYDPVARKWLEPLPNQPFPGGGSVSPIAVPTPGGVVVYQHAPEHVWGDNGQLWRFVGKAGRPDTWGWEQIKIVGPDRPHQREHMTIVYDTKRDRLIFLSHDGKTKAPMMWFFSMVDRRWVPNDPQPAGGISTREAVYIPDQDAILAYGPTRKDDPVWPRVYVCAENRWVPLRVDTPQFTVHEVGLEYDPARKVVVLMWPPGFERDIRPHLLRLDVSKLSGR